MTSTASTLRYGNQGGRFAPTRQTATCATCRNGTARWMCTRTDAGRPAEAWPVCGTCRAQGIRLRCTSLAYEAIGSVEP